MPQVYNVSASIEVVSDELMDFVENVSLPERICSIEINNSKALTLKSKPAGCVDVNKYIPTAQLKAQREKKRPKKVTGGQWKPPETEYGEEQVFFNFNGHDEDVLQNSKLRYDMFLVLKKLALEQDGDLTAVVCDGDCLTPVCIEDGEDASDTADVCVTTE